jgi:CubicO group peptidase (beta-lactamase class C family)
MAELRVKLDNAELNGFYDPKFEQVAAEFERNWRERNEVGASCSVTVEGETVVDLWGGIARPDGTAWQKDTVSMVFSCTKGATALCAHILASRGLLDLDAPVSQYWPEYGQNGKENTTVRMLLCHQSGSAAMRTPLPEGAFADWDLVVKALAEDAPFWTPGTMHGYSLLSFGWLVGEVVRRISGKSLGTFFQDEVAKPLGLDFWIGLPEEIEPRVALMIGAPPPAPGAPVSPFFLAVMEQGTAPFFGMMNAGGYMFPTADGTPMYDTRQMHAAEIGGAGGITNARGLAGMYAPLANGGSLNGVTLVDKVSLARMGAVASASSFDQMLMVPTRYSLGYFKAMDNRKLGPELSAIVSEDAFGHPGAGGSIGLADPIAKMSFGYSMNRMNGSVALDDRCQSLIDATYLTLGYSNNDSGRWIK